jgi:ATP-dependent Lhr-like helicase
MPHILEGKNVLLIAPTGTGKTEAAFLPLLHFLITSPRRQGIKALYITPLRALNRDMLERMVWWCRKLDVRLAVRHGDTSAKERAAQARAPPDILITTPETLQAILPARIMKEHLRGVRWVVVDEVHELAVDKRGSQLTLGLERLRHLAGDFQVMGLSATIGTPERVAKFLVGESRECEIIRVPVARFIELEVLYPKPSKRDYDMATRLYTYPEVASRLRLIRELVDTHRSALVFTNTRSTAEVLASRFRVWDLDIPLGIHHGSLSKPSRVSAERDLKAGVLKGIVCTSSLELGIDIGRLDLVIQYNSPRQVTRLLQRVGRSGHRLGAIAEGAVIAQDSDDFLEAAIIGKRALIEDLEPVTMPEKPLDVLSHQIAGLLLERRRWSFEEALKIFTKAHPYRNLTEGELVDVLEYMNSRTPRLAFYSKEDRVFMRPRNIKGLYRYYFETLSMIPEEKHFLVIEEESSNPIGLLDEAFVSEHGEIGAKFIERGSVWRVLHVYQDKVYVEGEEDPAGAIPSWVGEEIPVPYKVAREVGELRGRVEEELKKGIPLEEVAKTLSREYPCREGTLMRGLKEVAEQVEKGLAVPTHRRITIEGWKGYLILHCSFGLLVNKTLSRVLGHLISEEIGATVAVQQDPYRIVLKTEISAGEAKKILLNLCKRELEPLVKKALVKSGIFKRRLVQVARKFGALEKDADVSTMKLNTLLKAFKDTAIYREAVETALLKDADLENSRKVLEDIASGDIEVVLIEAEEISPIGRIGIEEMGRRYDLIPPEKMKRILLQATRARLLSEARTMLCTNCWDYIATEKVKSLPNIISCPRCKSNKVAFLDEDEEMVQRLGEKVRAGLEVPKRDQKLLSRALKSAELIADLGKVAALVLAGRNIAPGEAEGILKKEREIGDRLVELVMEAEKAVLKRRFFLRRAAI